MFPQGGTQWKVAESLLIQKSHLKQKMYIKKKRRRGRGGSGGDIKHTRRQSVESVRGKTCGMKLEIQTACIYYR